MADFTACPVSSPTLFTSSATLAPSESRALPVFWAHRWHRARLPPRPAAQHNLPMGSIDIDHAV
jgi:hypothetical protein